MHISCEGLRHADKNHILVDKDIAQAEAFLLGETYSTDRIYYENEDNGLEVLSATSAKLQLGGDFLLRVRLTKRDIATLVTLAFGLDIQSKNPKAVGQRPRKPPEP